MQSLGELSTLYPVGGAFSTLGNKFVDRAFGTVGWFYVIVWVAVLANEYNTTASILRFLGSRSASLWLYFDILGSISCVPVP